MSNTTLIQRLRDLRNGLFPDIETVNAVLDKAIAQAEAQEGQDGELSDEQAHYLFMGWLHANHADINDNADMSDLCRRAFLDAIRYARDHYPKPSQAIGEQTPVASAPVCMGCFSQEAVCRQPGLCVSGRPKWTPSGVSPEARDRAIEAGKAIAGLISRKTGMSTMQPTQSEWEHSLNAWDQALSALRV